MTKQLKTVAALVTALAILVTGTFAFQQIVSQRNEFIGVPEDVTLHDDFDPDTGDKDVYVENTGDAPLLIRVKLEESMNFKDNTWRPGDKDWITHKCGAANSHTDCGNANDKDELFHDFFTWHMGGSKWYMPAENGQKVVQDTTVYDKNSPGAKETPIGEFKTIIEYNALTDDEKVAYKGWVLDCADGYFYWSQLLEKGEVTGLLLNKVEISEELKNTEYYYAINVTVEAIDTKDGNMWLLGAPSVDNPDVTHAKASEEGKKLVEQLLSYDKSNKEEAKTIKVKPPANPDLGYVSHDLDTKTDEGGWFTIRIDDDVWVHEQPGLIRFADILYDDDYEGYTVKALDSKYEGLFKIGKHRFGNYGILYYMMPDYGTMKKQWLAGQKTFPITTEVLLSKGDKSVVIKLTCEFDQAVFAVDKLLEYDGP